MGESAGKRRKEYVDCNSGKSKTCINHGPGNYSGECKVLGYFGAKCANGKLTKDYGNGPAPREKSTVSRKIMPLLITWRMKSY